MLLRKALAVLVGAGGMVVLYLAMWAVPEVAEGLFFFMLLWPGAVWGAFTEV